MLFMLLASQLSAPVPTPVLWVRVSDYPMQYVQAGRAFQVDLRATIRADGIAQGCSVEKTTGEIAFDKYNCGLLLRRVKFKPATDVSGKPIVGVFRQRISWILDNRMPKPSAGDMELTVAKLPDGVKSPKMIDIALAVDGSGKPSGCGSGNPDHHPGLVKAACAALVKSYRATPARLPDGQAVPSVQTARVSFVTG